MFIFIFIRLEIIYVYVSFMYINVMIKNSLFNLTLNAKVSTRIPRNIVIII